MAFSPPNRTWKWPVELASEAQKYERAIREGMSMAWLRDTIDRWMASHHGKVAYFAPPSVTLPRRFTPTDRVIWVTGWVTRVTSG